ncbi:MAG: putative toxin-antitoxin system toxin component, PIN family [Oscillospiraceae bacterium]|nr:putative toxin-antitoxin system toxin component, PIN family [Oscillospiraceae bacterium]
MRIMVDTNTLISASVFGGRVAEAFALIIERKHKIVISDYAIDELRRVANRKFPHRIDVIERFLDGFDFELACTPPSLDVLGSISVRDPKDNPILASALIADVDVLITGDHDFYSLDIERPAIMTIGDFIKEFCT